MKNLFWIPGFVFFAILIMGATCSKKAAKSPQAGPAEQGLEGVWQLVGRSGGYAGLPPRPDSLQDVYLQLKDTSYIIADHGVAHCGSYALKKEVQYAVVKGPFLVLDGKTTGQAIRRSGDTLWLTDPFYDGFTHRYRRADTVLMPCSGDAYR